MAIKSKIYTIQKNNVDNVSIAIAEAHCEAEGLLLATWSSSFLLSNTLHKLEIDREQLTQDGSNNYSVLELGAGTGLTGLSAAAVWGTRSLLTDLPGIVPGLQVNVDLNDDAMSANGGAVACGTLDWNKPDTIHLHVPGPDGRKTIEVDERTKFPIVVAADTMYTEDHPSLLSQIIVKCLRRTKIARAIVMWPLRIAYIDHIREFWDLMDAEGLVAEQEGREEIDLKDWDDEKLHEWSVWKWKDL
ncbi:Protein-lysine N-methyltransferase rrg1 [Cytospora mali]|uniref:Protein-lysine N-methyltransferase rrg1 n=1 Tax=Cytospora mali TaxID=578113 RepID=A0A194VXB7_CYTMA|nr:Protein-lysine N-methyltransferase rrg1 [Valsa mali]